LVTSPTTYSACCGRRHAHIELHLLDVLGEALGEHVAHLAGGFARDVEGAHVGVVDGAVFVDHGAGLVGGAVLAGRGGELGVVPDDDGEDVARADLVVGGGRLSRACRCWR
jgi:L-alanine-DL-glutamate epimerase-like enolase superfamily enzyme